MGNLFGKPKRSKVTEEDKAILQLKKQRDELRKYQRRITTQMDKDRQMAKLLIAKKMLERAKLLLRKKKYQEKLLSQTDGQLENIEHLISEIERAVVEQKVLGSLEAGNKALASLHRLVSLEDAERIMADTAEGVEYQQDLDALLSGQLNPEDESGVLEELAALEAAAAAEEDLQLPGVPDAELPQLEEPHRPATVSDVKPQAMLAS